MKNWYSITNKANGPAEISIFGPIGNTWDGEGVTARQFVADFNAITSNDVTLSVNSPGGSLFDGVAIYTALAASGKNITAKVMGVAASAASLIVMAAKKISMPANTHLMVHKAGWVAAGNADELRAAADTLDSLDKSIVATYAARTGKTQDEVAALLEQGDVWMSADEAKAAGFADEVLPLVTVTNEYDPEKLPEAVRASLGLKPVETPPAPTAAKPLADQISALATTAGLTDFVTAFAVDPRITDAASAKTVIDEAGEVMACAKVVGLAEVGANLVRQHKTLVEARAALAEAGAVRDEGTYIDTVPPVAKTTPKNTASDDLHIGNLWNEIKAMQAGSKK